MPAQSQNIHPRRVQPYTPPTPYARHGKRRILRALCGIATLVALLGTISHVLPAPIQALPYVSVVAAACPWFTLVAVVALVLSLPARRVGCALIALVSIGLQVYWQYPFFALGQLPEKLYSTVQHTELSQDALLAAAAGRARTDDATARVMTFNVYKGQADAAQIVEAVRSNRVEVLALQETTDDFVARLQAAGIEAYLPYWHVSSSGGDFGNGLWSATPLDGVVDSQINSSASFMPAGSVQLGANSIRFVSVHTTSPGAGHWQLWRRSIEELALLQADTNTRFILMGDFNATVDHTPLREVLGSRFLDAAQASGHGFTFTWPANSRIPTFAGIDHILIDKGIAAGQCSTLTIAGSDHKALLATIEVQQ